jgi:phosphoglycerate kinase
MALRTLEELALPGKRVLVRADLDAPVDGEGRVADDRRIRSALPTLRHALQAGARLVVAAHRGRPTGKPEDARRFTLEPAAVRLSELLEEDVILADDCVGDGVKKLVRDLKPGQVLLLENVRLHPEEERNDDLFARELASLADVWVNDAFAAAHLAHASTAGVAAFVKERAAGFALAREVVGLRGLASPARPFVAVVGGARVAERLQLLERLLPRVDALLVGGSVAYTLLEAQGVVVGKSPVDRERLEQARQLLARAEARGVELLLPVDHAAAVDGREGSRRQVVEDRAVPAALVGLDVGPRTVDRFRQRILAAKTVYWEGPLGRFEQRAYAEGSLAVARALAGGPATAVVGGAGAAAVVEAAGLTAKMTHVSTGGDATLELVEGRALPGVKACEE